MNYKVELQNGLTFVCNRIECISDMAIHYRITIGDSVSYILVSDVRWIDPTFASTEIQIHRNQANRTANVIQVYSDKILVNYQMPNGRIFHNFLLADDKYKAVKL